MVRNTYYFRYLTKMLKKRLRGFDDVDVNKFSKQIGNNFAKITDG